MAHGGEATDTLQGTIMTGGVAMVGEMTMIEVVEGKMATTGSRRIGSAEVGVGSSAPLPGTGKIRWGPGRKRNFQSVGRRTTVFHRKAHGFRLIVDELLLALTNY